MLAGGRLHRVDLGDVRVDDLFFARPPGQQCRGPASNVSGTVIDRTRSSGQHDEDRRGALQASCRPSDFADDRRVVVREMQPFTRWKNLNRPAVLSTR